MFGYAPKNHNGLKSYCRDCENANCRAYRARRKQTLHKTKAESGKTKDTPVVNNLLEEQAVPVEELTFAQAIRQLVAYGSLTVKITLTKPTTK